jgi:flavin reductase (DIM6/NTAB) family NADH-FMN oxidoreductase RutF
VNELVGIGYCMGDTIDKFEKFGLTPVPSSEVAAPLIHQCFANFEGRLYDGWQIGMALR